MRSRWSYIVWICVFTLGAFRTFCIPNNEGKIWGNQGKLLCICRDMMVVVIPQKEHAVLEVKVLQSIGFLGGSG